LVNDSNTLEIAPLARFSPKVELIARSYGWDKNQTIRAQLFGMLYNVSFCVWFFICEPHISQFSYFFIWLGRLISILKDV